MFLGSLIVIGRTGAGVGDLCLMDLQTRASNAECAILDGFNETPELWRSSSIAASFAQWLDQMLTSIVIDGHPEYWMPNALGDSED